MKCCLHTRHCKLRTCFGPAAEGLPMLCSHCCSLTPVTASLARLVAGVMAGQRVQHSPVRVGLAGCPALLLKIGLGPWLASLQSHAPCKYKACRS